MSEAKKTRPTKKQFETLEYIREFIAKHGYSPSYREIMRGCNYTSVATVALHVKNLIARGHVQKRDKSARSLEVVGDPISAVEKPKKNNDLVNAIDRRIKSLEKVFEQSIADEVYVLVGALKLLGNGDAARAYAERLNTLKR